MQRLIPKGYSALLIFEMLPTPSGVLVSTRVRKDHHVEQRLCGRTSHHARDGKLCPLSDSLVHVHIAHCAVLVRRCLHVMSCGWFALGKWGPTDTGLHWIEHLTTDGGNPSHACLVVPLVHRHTLLGERAKRLAVQCSIHRRGLSV
eukprot:2886375-Amphidinium_carterae.1